MDQATELYEQNPVDLILLYYYAYKDLNQLRKKDAHDMLNQEQLFLLN